MAIAIPGGWRSPFRREADHFSAVLGMVIAIVGIILLSRLHLLKRAGQTGGSLASTGRWRNQVAAREGAHAQDQRSSQTSFPGVVPAPDSRQLCGRPSDRFRVLEGRRSRRTEMAGHRRMGRRPADGDGGSVAGKTRPSKSATGAGLRGYPPRTTNQQTPHLTTAVGGGPREEPGRIPLQPVL